MNKIISFFMAAVFTLLNFLGIPFDAPDLEPMPENPVSASAQELELLTTVFETETVWLASLQLDNGAIPMTPCENGEVKMNPYFADFAAMALLDCGNKYASQVRAYTEWHFEHLNTAETDHNGVDGTIYDYIITVSGGKVTGEAIASADGVNSYDSTDSYAATFLCVLNKYYGVTGDKEYIVSRKNDIERIVNAMLSTMHNGLTFAKPDYEVKYLMDNCEVYEGALAAAELFENALNDTSAAQECKNNAQFIKDTIERKMWNYFGNNYKVALKKSGFEAVSFSWDEYYPCATAQLFPINCGVIEPNTQRAVSLYNKFSQVYDWENHNIPDTFCWGSNAYAAALMGDTESVITYMTKYKSTYENHAYPLYNADSARVAMAAHIILEKTARS